MIKKQAFISHAPTMSLDFEVIYYSDVNTKRLYPHSHDFFEMYLLVSGKVLYRTEKSEFFLQPNDILFINRHQEHVPVLIDPMVPYERITLHVNPETLKELSGDTVDLTECFTTDQFQVFHYPPEIFQKIYLLLWNLFDVSDENRFGAALLGRAYLTELFVEINQYNHNPSIYSFNKDTKDMQLIALVKQYILEHLNEPITVDTLASYFFMSRYYFMHSFKRCSGTSVHSYITRIRLEAANEMIRGGASFTTASQHCGFGDYSNFFRMFRKEYGVSPRVWHKENGQG